MAHHKVGESVKDVKGKSCDEVEEEPGAEVVHLVGKVHKSDQQIKLTHSKLFLEEISKNIKETIGRTPQPTLKGTKNSRKQNRVCKMVLLVRV